MSRGGTCHTLTQTPITQVWLLLLLLLLLLLRLVKIAGAVVKAVVVVALRDISEGEELHFDYGYDPDSKHCPDWYQPVEYPSGVY